MQIGTYHICIFSAPFMDRKIKCTAAHSISDCVISVLRNSYVFANRKKRNNMFHFQTKRKPHHIIKKKYIYAKDRSAFKQCAWLSAFIVVDQLQMRKGVSEIIEIERENKKLSTSRSYAAIAKLYLSIRIHRKNIYIYTKKMP